MALETAARLLHVLYASDQILRLEVVAAPAKAAKFVEAVSTRFTLDTLAFCMFFMLIFPRR
jgi:hypothetical protein